jgi:hypothetical protein
MFIGSLYVVRTYARMSCCVLLGWLATGAGCASKLENESDASGGPPLNGGDLIGGDEGGLVGGGAEGGGASSFEACAGQVAGTEVAPSLLELIVDTSGSMDQAAPGTRNSKWEATRRALLQAIDRMPASTGVGVVFYPDLSNGNNGNNNVNDDDDGPCLDREVDVPLRQLDANGSQQRDGIRRAFQNQAPRGGTPTHDAYVFGLQELDATTLPGARFAVLITDGIPTFSLDCDRTGRDADNAVDPGPLVPEAGNALARATKTFVIGSPGSEAARESLSRMAEAGGTAIPGCSHDGPDYCHFDMTEEQDFARGLADALGQISGLALSCAYDIPIPPNGGELDPSKVNVLFSPAPGEQEVIAQSVEQPCQQGWQYSGDLDQVVLCGDTCRRVRESNGTLSMEFGCATQIR